VIVLSEQPPREALLRWRKLGSGQFRQAGLRHVARGVYAAEVAGEAIAGDDLEYYLEVKPVRDALVLYPPTAPVINQTVVIMP
jgi:hypothetical protein